jgi:uncharacterized membrane protein YdbT with pleckstrin-like domain
MLKKNDERVLWTDKPHNFLWFTINFTRYLLTEDKLIIRKGLFVIREDEIMLFRVMDKRVIRPITQRIFGCSTIQISAKDDYNPETTLKAIKDVDGVVDKLDKLVGEARQKNHVMAREFMGDY